MTYTPTGVVRDGRSGLRTMLAGLLAGVSMLLGATASMAQAPADMASEQVLRMGMPYEPPRISAYGDLGAANFFVFTLIHRGLVSFDAQDQLENALAESIDTTDQQTFVVTLREGLKFSDGTPITTANVQASLLHWAKPEVASHAYAGMKDIDTIEVTDDRVLTIRLKQVNASFLEYLADPAAAIMPDAALADGNVSAEIGAGPFRLADWDKGISMTFEKNDNYYDAENVYLERLEGTLYTDATARLNALYGGDVDFIDVVPWEAFDQIAGTPGLVMDEASANFQYVMFNVGVAPFDNPLVRQAVAYAINRDNSIRAAFYGHGRTLYGPLNGQEDTELWTYDPQKAKDLLAEAGHADGINAKFLTIGGHFYQDIALSLQADLKAVGINLELDAPDVATRNQRTVAGDYEITMNGAFMTVSDPLSYLATLVSGPPSMSRSVGYENAQLNQTLEEGFRSADPAVREAKLAEALEIIKTEAPVAFFNTRNAGYAYTERLKGFSALDNVAPYSAYTLEHAYLSN
mgnify:CR=1 FL=1